MTNMTNGEAFTLGTKWIGVYCLTGAVGGLFEVFPLKATRESLLYFQWSGWLSLVGPVVFLTMGIYLLKGDFYLRNSALNDNDSRSVENSQGFFDVFTKLIGLYLIAGVIPTCLWILGNVLMVLRSDPFMSVENELDAIRSNTVSCLATLLLGAFCLLWIGRFIGLIFRPRNGVGNEMYHVEGEMNKKGLFEVGAKLIGVYALVLVLPALLGISSMIRMFFTIPNESNRFGIENLPLLATPILIAAFGLYLMKNRTLADHVFPPTSEDARSSKLTEYFTIGIKLYGIYLLVGTISGFLQVLANLFFLTSDPHRTAGIVADTLGMDINVLSYLAVIALGLALLFKGEILASWVFPLSEQQSEE